MVLRVPFCAMLLTIFLPVFILFGMIILLDAFLGPVGDPDGSEASVKPKPAEN